MKNISNEAVNLLRQNARSVVRELGLLNDDYFDVGVTLAERHLLIELMACSRPTMGEIAERLLLDKSTVSRLIAKAVKKGYVKCSSDKTDKRKRFLQFTEQGKSTFNAFEPIAFNQTKKALQTLTADEIERVYQGIALYAKGLKNSRLKSPLRPKNTIESLEEINKQLSQKGFTLNLFRPEDENGFYEVYKEVVDSGTYFPFEDDSIEEFHRLFFSRTLQVYVCRSESEVIGGFYLRMNSIGRAKHIANAAYMIKSSHRGQGIGSLLVKASLQLAKRLGFQTMQFNLVLSQNTPATRLYQKLGFNIIGTIPEAICNPDGSYQDGYIMYRKLTEDLL
jgi:DNA-binding MarR family transcriptional regulator/L-amino acid N-acyltransferase YncA